MTTEERVEQLRQAHSRRKDLTVKVVHEQDGNLVVRVGWHESQIAGGPGGGWSRQVEVVRWYAWKGDTFLASCDRKKDALERLTWYWVR